MSAQTSLSQLVSSLTGQVLLLVGPPGTKKNLLAYRWILDGLRNDETAVIICVRTTAKHILREIEMIEPVEAHLSSGKLQFIDMVSARDPDSDVPPNTIKVQGVTDLMGLSAAIDTLSKKAAHARFLIDPVSFLMLYNNPAFVVDAVQTAGIRMASRNQSLLLINHLGVLTDQQNATLEALATTVFETAPYETDEGKISQLVRVKFSPLEHVDDWVLIV